VAHGWRMNYPTIDQPWDKTTGYAADTGDALAEWLGEWVAHPAQAPWCGPSDSDSIVLP
jgi:hypothetical protein